MKATQADQERLLELQRVDIHILQAEHRRKNLPELLEAARLEQQLSEVAAKRDQLMVDQSDVKREVAKAEEDVEQVRTRKEKDENRLASGTGSAKDLENLQHEVTTLNRRISELEEVELEIMVRFEEISREIDALTGEIEKFTAEKAALEASLREKVEVINGELKK